MSWYPANNFDDPILIKVDLEFNLEANDAKVGPFSWIWYKNKTLPTIQVKFCGEIHEKTESFEIFALKREKYSNLKTSPLVGSSNIRKFPGHFLLYNIKFTETSFKQGVRNIYLFSEKPIIFAVKTKTDNRKRILLDF
jgi:hypothetical protein